MASEQKFDAAQEFTNVILCCPVCQTNDEFDPTELAQPLVCNNCETTYGVSQGITLVETVAQTYDEEFTGAIVFCPVSGDQQDATKWGLNTFRCECNADFAIDLDPDAVRQYSMFG